MASLRQLALLVPPQQALLGSSMAGLLSRLLAVHLLAGWSLSSIAAELARTPSLLLGWLYGRVQSGRSPLRRFERRCFAVRRWHLALLALGAYKAVRLGLRLAQWAAALLAGATPAASPRRGCCPWVRAAAVAALGCGARGLLRSGWPLAPPATACTPTVGA
jgi:hypothetical protein